MDNMDWSVWRSVNLWLLPISYICLSMFIGVKQLPIDTLWHGAKRLVGFCLVLALLVLLHTVWIGEEIFLKAPVLQLGTWGAISFSARADMINSLFLAMVNFIGWIIVMFSHHYLSGERGQRRYLMSLLLTIAAVNVVVITNNIVVLALAWVMTSLALHALLTFYPSRPQALFAAHKKFLVSRLADLCLFCAFGLIAQQVGSVEIDHIKLAISEMDTISVQLQLAALFLALTATLKCAQLPFHGWLIQVMEAPTPVSALLHAGVVNLGGFLLIRFGFLMVHCASAQIFLVLIGSITAVISALVMMTRISIKVSLAWSTCAQMGFMMMQCGFGAYELASLHLLAHSLYKAYEFLNSGGTNARLTLMSRHLLPQGLAYRLLSGCIGLLIVFSMLYVTNQQVSMNQPLFAFAVILALGLAPLLSFKLDSYSMISNFKFVCSAGGLVLIYLGLHHVFGHYLGVRVDHEASWMIGLVSWVVVLFVGLYLVQSIIIEKPGHPILQRLYPYFYGGFFLDDVFTRLTFWIWPIKLVQKKG